MYADFIKLARHRIGITQRDLASWLDVDQGTVSRWERGDSQPRPATFSKIRALLQDDDSRRVRDRNIALVRKNLMPATLMDSQLRLREFSRLAEVHYQQRSGTALRSLVGSSLETQSIRTGIPELWSCVKQSGLLKGDAILLSFVVNSQGKGHVTVCEPFLKDGEVAGFLNHVSLYFDFPQNAERSLEFVQCISADNPTKSEVLFRGPRAEFCEHLLGYA